ncbi:MAG: 5-(carboxyamino)imidazole ribonucleotide mutase [Actinomycetota bacterium]|nr:5-(carboxyamino)imidazole ribonucleotide mutase [Actinomycetota bacterium]
MTVGGKKVAIVMGSVSDEVVMKKASDVLKEFGVEYEIDVLSAHRMPNKTREFAKSVDDKGIEVIIAGAGKAAHLPGVIASYTTVPVIGVPIKTSELGGMDSLLSIVQMPSGVPVACVSIDGAKNAAYLAIQILALKHDDLASKLKKHKIKMER